MINMIRSWSVDDDPSVPASLPFLLKGSSFTLTVIQIALEPDAAVRDRDVAEVVQGFVIRARDVRRASTSPTVLDAREY